MKILDGHIEYLEETWDAETGSTNVTRTIVPVWNSYCNLVGKQLENIPYRSICRLRTLVSLDLSWNGITYIPPELVEGLPELKHFHIGHNEVKALPSNIGRWVKLESLYAQFNKIKSVPDMRGLVKLELLNLRQNPLLKFWKVAFGEKWDLDGIEKAAIFARVVYRSTGLTEAEVRKRGNSLLGDPNFGKIIAKSGLQLQETVEANTPSNTSSVLQLQGTVEVNTRSSTSANASVLQLQRTVEVNTRSSTSTNASVNDGNIQEQEQEASEAPKPNPFQ